MVDPNGNVTITQGSINIGNGQFTVDVVGNVTMRHARIFGGEIILGNTTITESWLRALSMNNSHLDSTCTYLGPVNGGQVTVGTLNANRIQAGSITAAQIQAGSITAMEIAADAITANHIAANSIASNHIQADAITADMITTGTLSADRVRGGVLSGIEVSGVWGSFMDITINGLRAHQIFIVGENSLAASQAWVLQQIAAIPRPPQAP